MTQYLLQIQKDQIWKEESQQMFAKSICGLLHKTKRKKKVIETRFEGFKKMKFSGDKNDYDAHGFEGDNVLDTIKKCSRRGVDRLYDCLYTRYLVGKLSPEEWNVVENLLWNQGNPL